MTVGARYIVYFYYGIDLAIATSLSVWMQLKWLKGNFSEVFLTIDLLHAI